MKSKIIALALFAFTTATVALLPAYQTIGGVTPADPPVIDPIIDPVTHQRARIDVVFVLDTTGSMGGLIQAAREKIWSIATTLASRNPHPRSAWGWSPTATAVMPMSRGWWTCPVTWIPCTPR